MINLFNNKKATTYGAWFETIIFIILFVSAMAVISVGMNNKYDKSYDLSFNLVNNDTINQFASYTTDAKNKTGGQSSFSSLGLLQLATLPGLIQSLLYLLWGFVNGDFINKVVNMMDLGDISGMVIIVFKMLYWIALIFIFIKLILRVNP